MCSGLLTAAVMWCLLASLAACGVEPIDQGSPSGELPGKGELTRSRLPWLVTIYTPADQTQTRFWGCRGALVADNKVLTTDKCAQLVNTQTSYVLLQGVGGKTHHGVRAVDRSGAVVPLTDMAVLTLREPSFGAKVASLARWQAPPYLGAADAATIYDFSGDGAALRAHSITLAWRVAAPVVNFTNGATLYGVVLGYSDGDPAEADLLALGSAVVQDGALVGFYSGKNQLISSRRVLAMLDFDEALLARNGLRLPPVASVSEDDAQSAAGQASAESTSKRKTCAVKAGCRVTTYHRDCPASLEQGSVIDIAAVSKYRSWLFDYSTSIRCAIGVDDQKQWR